MFVFRRSTPADIDRMGEIGQEGKAVLKERGISQWARGNYPSRQLFEQDMLQGIGYVVAEGDEPVAVCAVTFDGDANYDHIRDGQWLLPVRCRYATVHRGAVARKHQGRGITTVLFDGAAELARQNGCVSVRADTHPDNIAMQRSLEKAGFVRCGVITLLSGDEAGDIRWAYEKVL